MLLTEQVKSEERRVKNLTALQQELEYLGLWKFAGAVMYVQHKVLALLDEKMHFVLYYPAEALSEPIFRTWHFLWRMWNKK
mgnify:FL=1